MSSELSDNNINRITQGHLSEEFISSVVSQRDKMEIMLKPWKANVVKYYELYKMFQRQKHYDGLATLFIPEILRAVETVVSNLYRAFFGSSPWYQYVGRTPDEEPAAQCETQLVDWQMDEGRFKIRVQDSLRQMAIAGLTVIKVVWDFEERSVKTKKVGYDSVIDKLTNKILRRKNVEESDETETIKDHWSIEPVDLLGFYISDVTVSYLDINRAEWIAEEYRVTKNWVRKQIKKGWYSDINFDELEEENQAQHSDTQQMKDNLLTTTGYHNATTTKGIMIYERWGLLPAKYVYNQDELNEKDLDEDDMVETVLVLANNRYIMKLEPNPYWHQRKPYLSCPYIPQSGEFAGIGVSMIGQSLQEELNDTRNQIMDNKTMVLLNMWLKSRASGIKNQDLRVRPMGVIPTNDMNGLKPLAPPILMGPGVSIESVVKNDLRESVGAPSNLQGIAQSGVSTATESTQINQQSLGRLALTSQLYSELILKPLLVMVEYLNYQYYDTEKVISVVGESGISFKKIKPDDIVGYKDVLIKISSDLDDNPGVRRQQLLQFLTVVQQIQPQLIPMYWKFLDKIYKEFFRQGHNLEDVLQAPPGQEQLLDPDQENEVLHMGKTVVVKQGDNDEAHIQSHEKFFEATKYALTDLAFKNTTQHIHDHYAALQQKQIAEAQKAQAAMIMQAEAANKKGKSSFNPGQAPGMTAFTQPNTPQNGNLSGTLGA